MRSSRGFSLIEILVAMSIMTFLAMFSAQSIRNSASEKSRIQQKSLETRTLDAAQNMIYRDVSMAFNYFNYRVEIFNLAQRDRKKQWEERKKKKTTPNPGVPPDPGRPPAPEENPNEPPPKFEEEKPKAISQFVGESESLHFSSVSHIRAVANSPTSRVAEVGYYLETCQDRLDPKKSSRCLLRRVDPVINEDVTKGGASSVILENVETFQLRYWGPGKEEWVKEWKSINSLDEATKGLFPYAVEVTITVKNLEKKQARSMGMTFTIPIQFPNNPQDREWPKDTSTPKSQPDGFDQSGQPNFPGGQ